MSWSLCRRACRSPRPYPLSSRTGWTPAHPQRRRKSFLCRYLHSSCLLSVLGTVLRPVRFDPYGLSGGKSAHSASPNTVLRAPLSPIVADQPPVPTGSLSNRSSSRPSFSRVPPPPLNTVSPESQNAPWRSVRPPPGPVTWVDAV